MVAAQKGKASQGRKGSKSNGRENSLRTNALEHLYGEAHVLTLRASFESQQLPALLYWYKLTKAVILITAGGRVTSAVAERPREEALDDSAGKSIRRGGSQRSRIHGYFETRSWPNEDDIDLTTTILQVGGPIGYVSW